MILDELASLTRKRIELQKQGYSLDNIKRDAELLAAREVAYNFEEALSKEGLSIISEVKKASPSKGVIAEDFPFLDIAKEYETAGADAVSCLTEPDRFKGSDAYLQEIASSIKLPVLRKDFTIDPYMIYQARMMGASAVLLIAAILSDAELAEYFEIAEGLGLSCLFEAHDEEEVKRCLAAGARIVGVNNRNLKDFTVDINNCINLRRFVPENVIFVAESGIKTSEDIEMLRRAGVNAVLIGETLMRAEDKKAILEELRFGRKNDR